MNFSQEDIDNFLTNVLQGVDNIDVLYEAAKYSTIECKGKRLRPFLIISICDLFDVRKDVAILYASAIELIHCYSLIHDDLPALDNDDFRRNKSTCHKKFSESTAILTGDFLLTKAFEIISDSNPHIPFDIQIKLINLISKAAGDMGLIGGQIMDLNLSDHSINHIELVKMQSMKTGALFQLCCEIGAYLSPIDCEKRHNHIKMYGRSIGAAFQIIDDILDYEKDAKNELYKGNLAIKIGLENAKSEALNLLSQANEMLQIFDSDKTIKLFEFNEYLKSMIG